MCTVKLGILGTHLAQPVKKLSIGSLALKGYFDLCIYRSLHEKGSEMDKIQ